MDYSPCINTYNNVGYRQRSQTLQPIRGSALPEFNDPKQFMLIKYFASQFNPVDSERANYANMPTAQEEPIMPNQTRHHSHHAHHLHHPRPNYQHVHSRSHSRHYYQPMCQVNDLNGYYNLSNIGTTIKPARSRLPSPVNEPPPIHSRVAQLDSITVMQVCVELGNLVDSPPPLPSSRHYTISDSRQCGLFKIKFPQRRYIKGQFTDHVTGTSLPPGSIVSVLGPSKEDRSKFTICYNEQHIDIPHQLTQLTHQPQPPTHWS